MRLTVNGDPVSFILESEERLGEVVAGVERWLGEEGLFVSALAADGEELSTSTRGRWEERPIDAVQELAVGARHFAELRLEHWRSLVDWLDALALRLTNPAGGDDLKGLVAGMPDAIQGLAENPAGARADALARRLESALPPAGGDGARPAASADAAAAAGELARLLRALLEEARNPASGIERRAEALRSLASRLGELPVQLATGRDGEAMGAVRDLSDSLSDLLPLLPFIRRDRERERLLGELNAVLRDLGAALAARDTVLTGDLAEYEVAPRLQHLADLLAVRP